MMVARVFALFLCFNALAKGQPSDTETMKAFKDSLKLPDNLWSEPDPCSWKGIKCVGSKVTRIQIGKSSISGTLPSDLTSLSSLTTFEVMGNSITGTIPIISGLRSLQTFDVSANSFTSIPNNNNFFTGLTSLQELRLHDNPLASWEIPLSLKDASSLVEFSAGNSNLSGKIPDFLGGLTFPSLTTLSLYGNSLFGELPSTFSDSPVQSLLVNGQKGKEKLNGSISVLQNMTSLTVVSLQGNSFSGPIPDLSRLVSLQRFNARENQLTGVVPASFTELQSLKVVNLTNNLLQGPTPSFKAKDIAVDVKEINSFCLDTPGDPCDPRVNTLLAIVEAFGYPVRLAESWKGNDPCSSNSMWLGITCSGPDITVINFKNMGLAGTISPRFSDLASLQVINLSQNNLTGNIPQELTKLNSLRTLDVSSNRLFGKVPDFRPNVVDTDGNPNIGRDEPGASPGPSPRHSGKIVGSVIGIFLGLVLIGLAVFFFIKKRRQYHKMKYGNSVSSDQDGVKITIGTSESGLSSNDGHDVFSINVLRDATDNFDERNILGRGGFGIVYKGELRDGTKIAVKRMELSVIHGKGLDEFKSEIAVLTKVRHRNLVALHGYCLEGNERLLVYQYMPQGTLSRHIFHWQEEGLKPLDWSRRLIIAVDVAKAVEYLHTLAQQSFIHRDLKPSNILIGDDMHAKVADFGLVRLAPEGNHSIETKIAGTFGYLAPEYAVTGRVTTKVDVYSFGVILMELLTGRKALDATRSEEDVHLPTWFRRMLINRDSFPKAIDETIEVNDEEILGSINKVAELASHCSAREPQNRPDMSHVVNVLVSVIEQLKPAEQSCRDEGDVYGIDYDSPLPQVSYDDWDHTRISTPSRPPGLDSTFRSGQGR